MENKEDKEDKKEEELDKEEGKNDTDIEVAKVKEGDKAEDVGEINEVVEEPAKVSEGDKKEEKQLKKVFIIVGAMVLFFLGVFILLNSENSFDYRGVKFYIDRQTIAGKTIYRTSLPVNSEHKVTGGAIFADYNFYLRKDPRKLDDLPVEGEINLMPNVVINFTNDFHCEHEVIAVANLLVVFDVLNVEAIKDETAGCDPDGRYTFLRLQTGEETRIEQFAPSCYNLNINNCEVLEVTEKYIVELFSQINKNLLE